jgi:hypothetical protein
MASMHALMNKAKSTHCTVQQLFDKFAKHTCVLLRPAWPALPHESRVTSPSPVARLARVARRGTAMEKLRTVTEEIPGGRSLTGPFRDARRFPSTR